MQVRNGFKVNGAWPIQTHSLRVKQLIRVTVNTIVHLLSAEVLKPLHLDTTFKLVRYHYHQNIQHEFTLKPSVA